ncbi:hypothetical protein [Saccharopolyspora mangrovi]|uniref:Antitoxin n=1 Tax=Saccharopolyspora mangrovi TaxID=3082379 RepID=A0ABU6A7E7_9PSEU|nr:hypothetical protein [Saccharopolyspora sp. S2-29]MEB3367431.1 hypothetical protein [Saccharopolyspora sp. S2-29]
MSMSIRDWTDEKDDVAYEIFRAEADRAGVPEATDLLGRMRTAFDLPFADRDVDAWVARYNSEEGGD